MVNPEKYVKCNLCKTRAKFKNMLLIPERKDSALFNAVCPRCVKNIVEKAKYMKERKKRK